MNIFIIVGIVIALALVYLAYRYFKSPTKVAQSVSTDIVTAKADVSAVEDEAKKL